MSKFSITDTFVYRHRFYIGYGLIGAGLMIILIMAGLYFPGGISAQETQSVVTSESLRINDFGTFAIANLPYHILQKLILSIFGVSILTIKLPSIILAFFSAIGIVLLLRRWFKPAVGVLASLVAIFTSQFVFFAQDGTPGILYIFWAVWLMLLSSMVIRKQKCKICYIIAFYIAAAASLYTPLSVYALIALVFSIMLHPHLRCLIRNVPIYKLAIGIVFAVFMVSPLVLCVINTPKLGLELLGIPLHWPNLIDNIKTLGVQYLGFAKPTGSTLMTPFFELGSMIIIAIGAIQVVKDRFTSKNYVIIFWVLCIIPVIILNPSFTSVTFLPLVLLLASGMSMLLSSWYDLFPRNPYARVVGIVTMMILVSVLIFSGAERHIYGYNYDPNVVPSFSKDLNLLSKGSKNLVIASDELAFYSVVAKYNDNITVSLTPTTEIFWATRKAKSPFSGYTVSQIVTSSSKDNGDRFYIYKKTE